MQPEISRRCLSCGAAVRAGARYCPQCGKEMGGGERPQADEGAAANERTAEAERPSPTPPPTPAPKTPAAPAPLTPAPKMREAEAPFEAPPTREFEAFSEGVGLAPALKGARDEAAAEEEARAEAADGAGRVARVKEHTRARVGRMREEALVVLEEAPDDSGMRFVVLAVVVFAFFVFMLIVSTTVLR